MSLLDALRKLEGGPRVLALGICSNIPEWYGKDFEKLAKRWPKHSGSTRYPVPHPTMGPKEAFQETMNLWEGEYGDNRWELLRWAIRELEAQTIGVTEHVTA